MAPPSPSFSRACVLALSLLVCFVAHAEAQCETGAPWTLVVSHAAAAGVFQRPSEAFGVMESAGNDALLASNLSSLESYRSDNGRFYFRLRWPELCASAETFNCVDDSNEILWSQTSNPLLTTSVTGKREGLRGRERM